MIEVSEATIVENILRTLNGFPGIKAVKIVGSIYSRRGTPDIIGSFRGKAFALEVKTPSGKLTLSQKRELKAWKDAGAISGVVTSPSEACHLLGLSRPISREDFERWKQVLLDLGIDTLELLPYAGQRQMCPICHLDLLVLPADATLGRGWVILRCPRCGGERSFPEGLLPQAKE